VDAPPHGTLGDYVPFYFAPQSPMLYMIWQGHVKGYAGGQEPVLYFVSSIETVVAACRPYVFTDGNAYGRYTRFSNDPTQLDEFVKWEAMQGRWFNDSDELPDRKNQRQAELLVHGHCPWQCIDEIAAINDRVTHRVSEIIDAAAPSHRPAVLTRADWYF